MHFLTLGFCTRTHRATDETTVAYKRLADLIAQKRKSEYGITLAWMAQLVEHRDTMREVVSSTPAGPTFRVLK